MLCKPATKKLCIFGCGTFVLLVAIVLGLLWPTLSLQILYSRLILANGSINFANWIETPLPMYIEFKFFNWTNPEELYHPNFKPVLVEMGPYVFLEKHKRQNLDWFDHNSTVSFNQTRTWHFVPEKSNGSLEDEVTSINAIASTVSYAVRYQHIARIFIDFLMRNENTTIVETKTVRELLFEGYKDPVLTFLKENAGRIGFDIPYDKFGWFVDRNTSASFDGRFNMFTGSGDISKLGILNSWNDENQTRFYRDECGEVNGTTGELWYPNIDSKRPLTLFASDLCRSLTLAYDCEVNFNGIPGVKWSGDDRLFDNGNKYPEQKCFCTSDPEFCPDIMPGVQNVSNCRYGAPAFISFPHFYLAHESYHDAVVGMKPDSEKHKFEISLEPTTGIPLEINARLQINMLLQPIKDISLFKNVPKIMFPMLWFQQSVVLDDAVASQAKLALMLPSLGLYVSYGFAGLGSILLVIGIALSIRKPSNPHTQFNNESDDELRT